MKQAMLKLLLFYALNHNLKYSKIHITAILYLALDDRFIINEDQIDCEFIYNKIRRNI